MIIHHPAISNTDSAGFIVVWISQIRLLRKPTRLFPKIALFAQFKLVRPVVCGILRAKGKKLKNNVNVCL